MSRHFERPLIAALAAAGLTISGCGGEPQARQATEPASPASPAAAAASPTASVTAEASPEPTAVAPSPPGAQLTAGAATETPSSPAAAAGTTITTGDSDFGAMLFDASKQAIYLFDAETTSRPECYDACAEAWPPVLTSGAPRVAGAARADLLGTTKRRDGTTQVTYAGHPLYYYAHERPGQVLCHDVDEYGGLWLVVTPSGRPAA